MKFEYGQQEFTMKFAYPMVRGNRATEVRIYTNDYHNPVDSATVVCHVSDKFVKDTGRKAAIKKMIKEYPYDFRVIIWDAYLNETFKGHLNTKKYKYNETNI